MCWDSIFGKKPSANKDKQKSILKAPVKKTVKMVLCGNAAVGKTSITMRYK